MADIRKALGILQSRKGPPLSKADLARSLLSDGFTVNEVSKAIPAAYSQVLTISKKMGVVPPKSTPSERITKRLAKPAARSGFKHTKEDLETIAKRDVPTARQLAKSAKIKKTGVTARVGKLRTPGLSTDIDVGECANCGHDLAVRKGGLYMLVHINTTAEEYLSTTQFCTAVPKVLL